MGGDYVSPASFPIKPQFSGDHAARAKRRATRASNLSLDDQDRRRIVVSYTSIGRQFYLFDRATKQQTLLGENANMKLAESLASVKPIMFQSRDGLTLHGYLMLPTGAAPKNLPTVLLVHGGPWFRDRWEVDHYTDTLAQFLANRGYAVAQINYRGSAGYGRAFMEAVIGEFGGKIQNDLLDTVQWLVGQGFTDSQHIVIMGRSFGGYVTLAGLAFTPDIFTCGVSIVGLSDLTTLRVRLASKIDHIFTLAGSVASGSPLCLSSISR